MRQAALGACALACVLVASGAAVALGDLRGAPGPAAVLLGLAVVGAGLAVRTCATLPAPVWLAGALTARAVLSFGTPSLSDDEHRYIHEGRAQRDGLAVPYRLPPAAYVPPADDGTTARVNHPDVPAAYPPGSELWFLATVAIGDALGAPRAPLRLSFLLADVLVVLLLYRARRTLPVAFVAYGLHPLPLLEIALSRHLDALGMLFVFLAVLAAARPRLAGVLAGLAMHVKPIGALALLGVSPGGRLRASGAALAVACMLALPHLAAGTPLGSGLLQYATRWRAAPVVYALLEAPLRPMFDARAARGVYAHAHVSIAPPALLIEEAGAPIVALGTLGAKPTRVLLDAAFFARLLAGALLGACVVLLARVAWSAGARAGAALAALWLLAPTVHPWYLLWIVPLAALTGSRALWTMSALAPVLYQPVFGAMHTGVFHEALWPRVVWLTATAIAAWLDWRARRA